ncbi:ABC transporter ATP-binding protein/permease [Candidatus Pelagibacter sp.]|nr:ABC transporter ATP-binding protein/permease [Candidatus Pelagibacter sp.]
MQNIKYLFSLSDEKDKFKIYLLLFFLILTTIFEILSLGILIPLTYTIFDINDKITSEKINFLNEKILIFDSLIENLIFLALIFLIKNLLIFYFNKFRIDFSSNLYLKNSKKIFENYLNLNYEKFIETNSYKSNQNVINELRTLIERLFNPFIILTSEILIFIVIAFFLISLDQEIVLFILFFLGVAAYLYFLIYRKFFKSIGEDRRINEAISRQTVIEGILGLKDIQILDKKEFFLKRFIKHAKIFVFSNNSFAYAQVIPRLVLECLIVFAFVGIIIITLTFFEIISSETIIIFLVVSYRILPSINRSVTNINNIFYSLPILEHFIKKNVIKLNSQKIEEIKVKKFNFSKQIEFKNLYFKFKKNKKYLFSNLNLKIKKNSFVGILGKSGVGKSTLINLLIGFLTPSRGKIKVDNNDLLNIKKEFQNKISYIGQEPFIIDDDIFKNITFSSNLSYRNKKKVINCLKKVNLYPDLTNKKKGLIEKLGTAGNKLSGGQKQKLILARALYFDKEILILDEATNSLDKRSEEEIFKIISKIKKKRTIIMITHNKELMKKPESKIYLK